MSRILYITLLSLILPYMSGCLLSPPEKLTEWDIRYGWTRSDFDQDIRDIKIKTGAEALPSNRLVRDMYWLDAHRSQGTEASFDQMIKEFRIVNCVYVETFTIYSTFLPSEKEPTKDIKECGVQ